MDEAKVDMGNLTAVIIQVDKCLEPEAALKMMERHKTKGMCRLSPNGNYELILE